MTTNLPSVQRTWVWSLKATAGILAQFPYWSNKANNRTYLTQALCRDNEIMDRKPSAEFLEHKHSACISDDDDDNDDCFYVIKTPKTVDDSDTPTELGNVCSARQTPSARTVIQCLLAGFLGHSAKSRTRTQENDLMSQFPIKVPMASWAPSSNESSLS